VTAASALGSRLGPVLAAASLLACSGAPSPAPALPPTTGPAAPPREPPPSFTLTAMDVGTGLAVLVRGEDFALLYDAGSNDDLASGEDSRALAYLAATLGPSGGADCHVGDEPVPERRIDHVFLSHPHRDHLSMLPDVLRCYAVANVWEPGATSESDAYATFEAAVASEAGVRHHVAGSSSSSAFAADTRVHLGRGADAVVLSVRPDARDPNDASIVLSVELAGTRVLFMGDATAGDRADPSRPPSRGSVEGALLAQRRARLAADVLIVGHHGSRTSSRDAFLDAVRPRFAVLSSGPKPYGRVVLPDPEVVSALEAHGARVLRTDTDDEACRRAPEKIGKDADGAPGGCSAVELALGGGRPPRVETAPTSD
jgi:competence protein ComEC